MRSWHNLVLMVLILALGIALGALVLPVRGRVPEEPLVASYAAPSTSQAALDACRADGTYSDAAARLRSLYGQELDPASDGKWEASEDPAGGWWVSYISPVFEAGGRPIYVVLEYRKDGDAPAGFETYKFFGEDEDYRHNHR